MKKFGKYTKDGPPKASPEAKYSGPVLSCNLAALILRQEGGLPRDKARRFVIRDFEDPI